MNGYSLSRQWYSFASKNRRKIRPIHHAVIHWAFHLANQSDWSDEFQMPTSEACEILGISDKHSFLKAIKELEDFGAIKVVEESQNRFTARWVSVNQCEMYHVENTHATTHATTHASTHATTHATTTIYKTKETNKPKNKINIDFDVFWNAYDKKVDKTKAEKKWNSLTDQERQLAIEDIPKYLASLDDRKYQKNPLTYLNGECWKDERQNPKILPIGQQAIINKNSFV